MKVKPGKYVQRDGGIATVAAVDETKNTDCQAIGWRADGEACRWHSNGSRYFDGTESACDLMREYREPRECWVVGMNAFESLEHAESYSCSVHKEAEIVHMREVVE